jgi:hypothetical protein
MIIEHLQQTVTPELLVANERKNIVAYFSLLAQFYALLASYLASSELYAQLQNTERSAIQSVALTGLLFEQLWQQSNQRSLLIQELVTDHYIDTATIKKLLINATPLVYQQLNSLADGQYLPAFLQMRLSAIQGYLPVWAASFVAVDRKVDIADMTNDSTTAAVNKASAIQDASIIAQAAVTPALPIKALSIKLTPIKSTSLKTLPIQEVTEKATLETTLTTEIAAKSAFEQPIASHNEPSVFASDKAIDSSPAAEHYIANPVKLSSRYPRHNLLVPLLGLSTLLLAIALFWSLFFRTDNTQPAAPVAIAPALSAAETVLSVQTLLPAQLLVSVDDGGNLYNCKATVGAIDLQAALKQALRVSFAEQAHICEVTVQQGLALTLADIDIAVLPDILTLLRAVPFAQLQLQNNVIDLTAPDQELLQRLLEGIRSLVPAMAVNSAAPIMLSGNIAAAQDLTNMPAINETANELELGHSTSNNNSNNINANSALEYQQADDDSAESFAAAPESNSNNSRNSNNNPAITQSAAISSSELEDLANSTFISEPAQGGRPVDKNVIANK